jgi:hypothetical protein
MGFEMDNQWKFCRASHIFCRGGRHFLFRQLLFHLLAEEKGYAILGELKGEDEIRFMIVGKQVERKLEK